MMDKTEAGAFCAGHTWQLRVEGHDGTFLAYFCTGYLWHLILQEMMGPSKAPRASIRHQSVLRKELGFQGAVSLKGHQQ